MVRQVEIQIKTGKITPFLSLDLIDMEFGKDHTPFLVVRVRQREEPYGPKVLFSDLFRVHLGKLFPGHPIGQLDPYAFLYMLSSPGDHHPLCRTVA